MAPPRRKRPRRKKVLSETERITDALGRAVAEALLMHKRAGNPVCEWRDGKVRWIAPEDIPDFTDGKGGLRRSPRRRSRS